MMAKPSVIPPASPPSQAADKVPQEVTLPETKAIPPSDPGMPADLPMIPIEAFASKPDFDKMPEDVEPEFPDFLPF